MASQPVDRKAAILIAAPAIIGAGGLACLAALIWSGAQGGLVWSVGAVAVVIAIMGPAVSTRLMRRELTAPLAALAARIETLPGLSEEVASKVRVGSGDDIDRIGAAVDQLRRTIVEAAERQQDAQQARVASLAETSAVEAAEAARESERAQVSAALTTALRKMAQGDLTHRVRADFPADRAVLRDDLNAAFEMLQTALGRISGAALGVRGAATDIAAASDDLSRRTESQAASLEQSAAAIEQITATTRHTAESAAHARDVVARARAEAQSGGEVVRGAIDAMGAIEASSEQIGRIIGVIDEIAFQTNLLALNAGVEAARAGEAGRGFAVVASEVRALAQRSADAAKEIKGLILSSKQEVEKGVERVGVTGEALGRIVAGVAEIDGVVGEIARAAQEQATGLQEVNSAVSQMDQITQQNAAMVEQATTAVRALSRQTDSFATLLAGFELGAAAAQPARPTPKQEVVAKAGAAREAGALSAGPAASTPQTKRRAVPHAAARPTAPKPAAAPNLMRAKPDDADPAKRASASVTQLRAPVVRPAAGGKSGGAGHPIMRPGFKTEAAKPAFGSASEKPAAPKSAASPVAVKSEASPPARKRAAPQPERAAPRRATAAVAKAESDGWEEF